MMLGEDNKLKILQLVKEGEKNKVIITSAQTVPNTAVPAAILSYMITNKPNAKILKIEKDRVGYKVSLTGGEELNFDNKCKFIHYDN
ncbi:MAG: PepSY-like domain-containing protein [Bacteroidales bacterium]